MDGAGAFPPRRGIAEKARVDDAVHLSQRHAVTQAASLADKVRGMVLAVINLSSVEEGI